jgi:biotin synthase
MCYAIPGKVTDISGNQVTIDYFGEKKTARNDFQKIQLGDYIYAQGGFVINRLAEKDALEILASWKELFHELKKIDLKLSRPRNNLLQIANNTRQKHLGNSCCIHGIIEFSNHCQDNCLYCGIRRDHQGLERYRLSIDEIVSAVEFAVNQLGFKALVLQSGEDLWYTEDKLVELVKRIWEKCAVLLFISIGERDFKTYHRLYEAGARGVLLRFETSNPAIYRQLRPGRELATRLELAKKIRDLGYLLITGSIIGLPGASNEDHLNDIKTAKSLAPEMYSFGPLVSHPATPLSNQPTIQLESILEVIARCRIMDPEGKIVVTTAMETLYGETGKRQGLMAGANSLMLNVTPIQYRKLYDIYPNRAGADKEIEGQIKETVALLRELGRAPTDLGL